MAVGVGAFSNFLFVCRMSTKKRKRGPFGGGPSGGVKKKARPSAVPGYTRNISNYKLPSGELKFFDVKHSVNPIQDAQQLGVCLNNIAQGVGESERVGRKVIVRSIHCRLYINLAGTSDVDDTDEVIRVVAFLDKQTNGLAVYSDAVMKNTEYNVFRNMNNTDRFRVLWDKTIPMNAQSGAYNGATDKFGSTGKWLYFNKKVNIPIEFSGSTGQTIEIRSNSLNFYLTAKSGGNCSYRADWRIRYTDA